jgi:hypothetical protein
MQHGIMVERDGAVWRSPSTGRGQRSILRRPRLNSVFEEFRDDAELRVVIITGRATAFLAGLGLGRSGGRKIGRRLGPGGLRRPQLSAQPEQADHRGGQRHRLRRRFRDRARHRHHRDGGARTLRCRINVAVLADAGTIAAAAHLYHVAVSS